MFKNKFWAALIAALMVFGVIQPAVWADLKISQLATDSSPTTADEVPVNASGTTKKVTLGGIAQAIGYTAHAADSTIHRSINDAGSASTDLFSASHILSLLAAKSNTGHTHAASDITSGTLGVTRGGTGLSSISAGNLLYGTGSNTLGAITLSPALSVSSSILGVVDNTSIQKVGVSLGGSGRVNRQQINLINTSTITFSVSDNAGTDSVDVSANMILASYPTGFHGSAPPVYINSSSFSQAYIRERSNDDTVNITKSGSTTVDLTTTGLNGIARSTSNLTGTIAYTNASAAVTGTGTTFSSDLVPGDTLWDQTNSVVVGVVQLVTDNTHLTLTANFSGTSKSGANFRRGAKANSSQWHEYAITDGVTPGLIMSNRSVANGDTLVDLPAGYSTTTARQLRFSFVLSSSANLIPFIMTNWNGTPVVLFRDYEKLVSPYNILNAGAATSFTSVSAASLAPKTSKVLEMYAESSGTASAPMFVRATGSGLTTGRAVGTVVGSTSVSRQDVPHVLTDSSQSIDYKSGNASSNVSLDVEGYDITEVP